LKTKESKGDHLITSQTSGPEPRIPQKILTIIKTFQSLK
jgi:hypothetical protein